jgi:hypothetical protein
MDPSRLPPSLRVPAAGDLVSATWRADIGAGARLNELADVLRDLDMVIGVGERWGTTLARAAAQYQLVYEIEGRGPRALIEAARQIGLASDVVDVGRWFFDDWLWSRRGRPGRPVFWSPDDLVRMVADARTPELLGSPMYAGQVEYRNPLEVILSGSGFLILGTTYALRMVRDWSNTRRQGSAMADEAAANARRHLAQADLMEWLVDEAKAGRLHVAPGDLLNGVTPAENEAMSRLAEREVQLQLPPGTDPPA